MRKYTQITVVISMLFFLVWLRSATFKVNDIATIGVKKNNPINFPNLISPTLTLTPTPVLGKAALNKTTTTSSVKSVVPTTAVPTVSSAMQATQATLSTPTPTTAPPVQTGQYKDGTYVGSVVDAFYGNVQVQAVISGGQITDVIFLQYPNHNNTSININSQAMPLLKQEALAAQSANVSGVSGASATSPAFQTSLADALSLAK